MLVSFYTQIHILRFVSWCNSQKSCESSSPYSTPPPIFTSLASCCVLLAASDLQRVHVSSRVDTLATWPCTVRGPWYMCSQLVPILCSVGCTVRGEGEALRWLFYRLLLLLLRQLFFSACLLAFFAAAPHLRAALLGVFVFEAMCASETPPILVIPLPPNKQNTCSRILRLHIN